MDASARVAELALVSAAESSHAPDTITEVTLSSVPHLDKLLEELSAVSGVSHVGIWLPPSYPGTVILHHNALTSGQQAALSTAATDHDSSTVPSLSLDVSDLQVSGNGVATGTITVTDSRDAGAENVVLDVVPPPQPIALDKTSITLNASGQGTLAFGPSPASGYVSGKMPVGFRYQGAGVLGDGADATCQYT